LFAFATPKFSIQGSFMDRDVEAKLAIYAIWLATQFWIASMPERNLNRLSLEGRSAANH
jgi:hypothetical protein